MNVCRIAVLLALVLAPLTGACNSRTEGREGDLERTGREAGQRLERAAEDAGETAEEAAGEVEEAVEGAVERVREGVDRDTTPR